MYQWFRLRKHTFSNRRSYPCIKIRKNSLASERKALENGLLKNSLGAAQTRWGKLPQTPSFPLAGEAAGGRFPTDLQQGSGSVGLSTP